MHFDETGTLYNISKLAAYKFRAKDRMNWREICDNVQTVKARKK